MSVRRVYVEKKADYAVKAGELREELASYLGIEGLKKYVYLLSATTLRIFPKRFTEGAGDYFFRAPGG